MIFSPEILTESILDEAKPLLSKHWEEISFYKDIPLDPDYDQYLLMQKVGMLRCFSAREGDGKLVGYAVFIVQKNAHYKNCLYAKEDILYIDSDRRGTGLFFVRYCDEELKKLGVQIVSHHIKLSHDWSSAAERIGYDKQEMVVTKRLDR